MAHTDPRTAIVHRWALVPLVLLLLREQGRLRAPFPLVYSLPWYTSSFPEDASVVNLNGLLLRATER